MGLDGIFDCHCIGKQGSALGGFVARIWALATLVGLAAGGLVGWFVVAMLPILGLFVFAGLLLGVAWVKSIDRIARARSSWSRGNRRRSGVLVAEP